MVFGLVMLSSIVVDVRQICWPKLTTRPTAVMDFGLIVVSTIFDYLPLVLSWILSLALSAVKDKAEGR